MTTELERTEVIAGDLTRRIVTLRDQIAPAATLDELAYFGQVCQRLGLDPFAGQIVFVPRWNASLGRKVHQHQVTVAGRRAVAARTGELVGIEGPEWCGPRNERGELVWSEVWDRDPDPPYCARVLVHRRGWIKPANGTAKWSEFAQTNREGDLLAQWAKMPSHMLGKTAESLALRRAFPEVITAEVIGGFDELDPDPERTAGMGDPADPAPPLPSNTTTAPDPAVDELDELEARIAELDPWVRDELRAWWVTPPPLPNVRQLDRDELAAVTEWLDHPPTRQGPDPDDPGI